MHIIAVYSIQSQLGISYLVCETNLQADNQREINQEEISLWLSAC
jgi:hypothetical protein